MSTRVKCIYEKGMFRPLEKVDIEDNSEIIIKITN